MEDLKTRIKVLMDVTGATQRELAMCAEGSEAAVSQWLGSGKGTKSLGLKTATKLAAKYGFSPQWLATGEGPRLTPSDTPAWPFRWVDQALYERLGIEGQAIAQHAMQVKVEELASKMRHDADLEDRAEVERMFAGPDAPPTVAEVVLGAARKPRKRHAA